MRRLGEIFGFEIFLSCNTVARHKEVSATHIQFVPAVVPGQYYPGPDAILRCRSQTSSSASGTGPIMPMRSPRTSANIGGYFTASISSVASS